MRISKVVDRVAPGRVVLVPIIAVLVTIAVPVTIVDLTIIVVREDRVHISLAAARTTLVRNMAAHNPWSDGLRN